MLVTRTLVLTPTYESVATSNGVYSSVVSVGGFTGAFEGGAEINPGRPIQPYFSLDVKRNDGFDTHGVLFLAGNYTALSDYDPVVARIVTDTWAAEPAYTIGRWYPTPMHFINRLSLGRFNSEKLVVIPAQYQANGQESNQRIYRRLNYVLYDAPVEGRADFVAPDIVQVQLLESLNRVLVSAVISDSAGVIRVVATCDDGKGLWQSYDLHRDNVRLWSGAVAQATITQCIVQAVDAFGNVAVSDNKGIYFRALAVGIESVPKTQTGAMVLPGNSVVYVQTITNHGGGADTYWLTYQNLPVWASTATDKLISLDALQSIRVTVTLDVPGNAISSTTNILTATVTSLSNPLVSDTLTYTTMVRQVFGVALSPGHNGHGAPGTWLTYTHLLTNTGNSIETFVFSASLGTLTPPKVINLGPGQSSLLTLTLQTPQLLYHSAFTTTIAAWPANHPGLVARQKDVTTIDRSVGVTLSASQAHSGYPGEKIVITHTLANTGNLTDTYTLTARTVSGWPVNLPSRLTVLTIPITATSISGSQAMAIATDVVTVSEQPGQKALPGANVIYTHTVHNTGNSLVTFHIAVSPNAQVTPSNVSVAPYTSISIMVSLMVPAESISGTQITTLVTVTSLMQPGVQASRVDLTTVGHRPAAQLSAGQVLLGKPMHIVTFTHTLTNTGNFTDTFHVGIIAPPAWTVTANPSSMTLPQQAAGKIQLQVQIPASAGGGTSAELVLRIHSSDDGGKALADAHDFVQVQAQGYVVYLPLVMRDYPTMLTQKQGLAAQSYRNYVGTDMAGWEVVLGDGVFAAPSEPPVSLNDIESVHFGSHSALRANLSARKIMAHNITFLRIQDDKAIQFTHTSTYQFKLPHQPVKDHTAWNGETVEGHLSVWDGRSTRLEYLVGFQWVINPWATNYGALRAWKPPAQWENVGFLNPDTAWGEWHVISFSLDIAHNQAGFQLDDMVYEGVPVALTHPTWGTDVSAQLAAEVISLYPGEADGTTHEAYFRNWRWIWELKNIYLPVIMFHKN